MSRTRTFDHDAIREAFNNLTARSRAAKVRAVCIELKCSPGTVLRALNNRTTSNSAQTGTGKGHKRRVMLPHSHRAMVEMTTLFPGMVFPVGSERLLKSADNSAKIGRAVVKGKWKGMPIYTLTLEERASCPVTCELLGSCYGNSTPFARRWQHGPALEWRLEREVAGLELAHPGGFVVRLHNLGDFYSVGYVQLWGRLLAKHDALRVFGYTAHIDVWNDAIAYELAMMVRADDWDRFCIRFSNGEGGRCTTKTIEHPASAPLGSIICPAQTEKTESCATCALCWTTTRRIAFLHH